MNCLREYIAPELYVCVNERHKFGADALLLARFARLSGGEHAFDLGSGCAAVSATLFERSPAPLCVTAVELDSEAVSLARLTAKSPAVAGRIHVHNGDIRNISTDFEQGRASLVLSNPPYFEAGRGARSPDPARRAARSDVTCTLDDVCRAAAHLLRSKGRFTICYRPENILKLADAMRRGGIEPKRIALAAHSPGKRPFLLLCEGVLGARPGLVMEPCIYEHL